MDTKGRIFFKMVTSAFRYCRVILRWQVLDKKINLKNDAGQAEAELRATAEQADMNRVGVSGG